MSTQLPNTALRQNQLRLNLGCGDDIREGCVNIDIFTNNNPLITKDNAKTLESVKDNSVTDITAINLIQYFNTTELPDVLTTWTKKLIKDGRLYLQSTDYSILGTRMAYENITTDEVNEVLYQQSNNIPIKSIVNLTAMDTVLNNLGFAVTEKGYIDNQFYIEAVKL